jgi:hypothetical protein
MVRLTRCVGLLLAITAIAGPASAQLVRGVVVDQTGLPLPGATVQLLDGQTTVTTLVTGDDGTFVIDAALPGDAVVATLAGFEETKVRRADATRVTMPLARAVESTTVVADSIDAAAPSAPVLGATLTANTVTRLPSSHMRARESLPLLPSVIRGPDGLMQLGGARAHETPLVLDGFNIGDPATGASTLNLPIEIVRGVDVMRDPMSVSYGSLIGGLTKMDTRAGADQVTAGVQGFVPRPRFSVPGFGRLEGIFPRAYVSGSSADRSVRYVVAGEYDYERIAVPDVTQGAGPNIVEQSAVMFSRVDTQLSPRNGLTVEGFVFSADTQAYALSPRRTVDASPNVGGRDVFVGVTHRFASSAVSLVTVRFGALEHDATLTPVGSGPSYLDPSAWSGNWFSTINRTGRQYSGSVTWDRSVRLRGRTHDLSVTGDLVYRRLNGRVAETPVIVTDGLGRVMRSVEFGAPAAFGASDRPFGLAVRDVWQATARLQVDGGARVDHSRYGGAIPSARAGIRLALDESGHTVVKAGYGSFVGNLPLSVPAFGMYPWRLDRSFDPSGGQPVDEKLMQPEVGSLHRPTAVAGVAGIERQIRPGLVGQISFVHRESANVATFCVPETSGALTVDSSGSGSYREVQISARQTWVDDQQLFVSYVRSEAEGELNDFTAVFQGMDATLLQPGGRTRLATDARNRIVAWGTFNLPSRVVVSPVTEWRSGFLFSTVNHRYQYFGQPNSSSFPAFLSTDMVVYKTVTVMKRSADLGVQIFNLFNHRNPRDVYPVVGAPRMGNFTNSVGTVLRGYMLLKW